MVIKPLKVTLENVPEGHVVFVEKAVHPKVPALGTAKLPFTRTVSIDRDDFVLKTPQALSVSHQGRRSACSRPCTLSLVHHTKLMRQQAM